MLMRIFEKDVDTVVFSEFSKLTNQDQKDGIRLNPLPSVKEDIDKERVPLMILKPLVETQNARKLLDYFANSKALWMYRNYTDVVSSNVKKFGAQQTIGDLRDIVDNVTSSWRAEYIPEDARQLILENFSEDMNPNDAGALFWYVRNHLFFDLELDKHPRVMICRYRDFVTEPLWHMERIYKFLHHRMPNFKISKEVRTTSLGKGSDVVLSPAVEDVCGKLLERLDIAYQADIEYSSIAS